MLTEKIKDRLKANWSNGSSSLYCFVEVKFIDIFSDWACYIFALDPIDEDLIHCIVQYKCCADLRTWSLSQLLLHYNTQGEYPVIDDEFRPIRASELWRKLNLDG